MHTIKNIIFDLGNVLLDIDYNKTIHAFEQLGFQNFKASYSPEKMGPVFEDIETGKISEEELYAVIQSVSKTPVSSHQIRDAWNALLLDFRVESLEYLKKLPAKYTIYLLSNTNSIHLTAFNKITPRPMQSSPGVITIWYTVILFQFHISDNAGHFFIKVCIYLFKFGSAA